MFLVFTLPPSLQTQVGGGVFSFHHHTSTHPPSLASNASWRVVCHLRGRLHSPPPIPPPSLQMRVGGGVFRLQPPPIPLPRFKHELEGSFVASTHSVPPPSLQCESEGVVSVFTHHTTTHPPSLASNASRRGCLSLDTTCSPSLASNTSWRGNFFSYHPSLHPP